MNKDQIRASFRKGLVFAIILIFMVLIDFEVMAATFISKILGTNVLRGGIPEVRFMLIFLILFGVWVGWAAVGRSERPSAKLMGAFIAGLTMGIIIALFGMVLNYLLQSKTDVRRYLAALSPESMKVFLFNLGGTGPLAHLGLFTGSSFIGGLLSAVIRSQFAKNVFQNIKSALSKGKEWILGATPSIVRKYAKYILYLALVAVLLILPGKWGSYNNYVAGLVGLYVILGIGLNIIVGVSGQLMLGFAAYFAMGAYSVALLNAPAPHGLMWGFWPALIIGILMAIIAAILIGLPVMRLRGDYLAIVTLGFGEIIRILLKSDLLTSFTGGPRGIQGIQGPTLFGRPFNSDINYTHIILVCVILAIFIYNRLEHSRTGRAWLAIKEDTIVAQATGVNVQRHKLLALCIGAAFAGLAGGIFAARNQFTGPNDHALMVSMNILSIVIVGGMNSIPGIILGAFTLKGLPEILREIENYRLLAFGALLVLMMIVRPEGLWPATRPSMEQQDGQKKEENISPGTGGRDA